MALPVTQTTHTHCGRSTAPCPASGCDKPVALALTPQASVPASWRQPGPLGETPLPSLQPGAPGPWLVGPRQVRTPRRRGRGDLGVLGLQDAGSRGMGRGMGKDDGGGEGRGAVTPGWLGCCRAELQRLPWAAPLPTKAAGAVCSAQVGAGSDFKAASPFVTVPSIPDPRGSAGQKSAYRRPQARVTAQLQACSCQSLASPAVLLAVGVPSWLWAWGDSRRGGGDDDPTLRRALGYFFSFPKEKKGHNRLFSGPGLTSERSWPETPGLEKDAASGPGHMVLLFLVPSGVHFTSVRCVMSPY
jgi:hypothetical protein